MLSESALSGSSGRGIMTITALYNEEGALPLQPDRKGCAIR